MNNKIISVILTGGKSSRMNYLNKSFLKINNQFFIEKIIGSLKDKTETICINANNDIERYKDFKLTVIQDVLKGYKGPLAGLHSAMKYYKKVSQDSWFAIFPTDAPIIDTNLIDLFQSQNKENCKAYIAKIDNVIEPMFSFWSIKSFDYLDSVLKDNDGYKIMKFAQEIGFEYLNFKKRSDVDFFNVNSPEDYENLLRLVQLN